MASSEERMQILRMIQEEKITVEEGMRLLETLSEERPPRPISTPASSAEPTLPQRGGPRWFHVQVTDTNTGKTRVNIRLPLSVVTAGSKLGARFSTNVDGLDMNQLNEYIRSGVTGKVVDIYDEQDGEHVEVFLE